MKNARQEIMDRLKNSVYPVPEMPDFDAPVYHSINKPLELAFKENLEKVNGSVYLFASQKKLYQNLREFLSAFNKNNVVCFEEKIISELLTENIQLNNYSEIPENIEVGITGCEFLIAHTGSVMVSSAQKGGRQMFVYPPVHIVVAEKAQLTAYLDDAYASLIQKYSNELPSHISLITGPSRTADIEKTLILGAHGPKQLHVFLA